MNTSCASRFSPASSTPTARAQICPVSTPSPASTVTAPPISHTQPQAVKFQISRSLCLTAYQSWLSSATSPSITVIDPSTIIMIAANTTQPAHPVMGSRGGVALLAALSSGTTQSDSLVDDSLCDIAPPLLLAAVAPPRG